MGYNSRAIHIEKLLQPPPGKDGRKGHALKVADIHGRGNPEYPHIRLKIKEGVF